MAAQAGAGSIEVAPAGPRDAADESDYLAAYAGRLTWSDFAPVYRRIQKGRLPLSWSFGLFFFPWIWLIYRKMPVAGIAVWAVDAGAIYVSPWFSVLKLAIGIGLAIFGRALFVRRAMDAVALVRAAQPDRDAALAALQDQGMAKGAALFGLVIPLLLILTLFSTIHFQISFN
jgi:hypothetical protein